MRKESQPNGTELSRRANGFPRPHSPQRLPDQTTTDTTPGRRLGRLRRLGWAPHPLAAVLGPVCGNLLHSEDTMKLGFSHRTDHNHQDAENDYGDVVKLAYLCSLYTGAS